MPSIKGIKNRGKLLGFPDENKEPLEDFGFTVLFDLHNL